MDITVELTMKFEAPNNYKVLHGLNLKDVFKIGVFFIILINAWVMVWIVSPQNSNVKARTPKISNVTKFGDRASKEAIMLKWGH